MLVFVNVVEKGGEQSISSTRKALKGLSLILDPRMQLLCLRILKIVKSHEHRLGCVVGSLCSRIVTVMVAQQHGAGSEC
ncbi:hypothetical protein SLEP1_g26707 [Rubroshorea leprosula]|uniref:Uncharacterized protein n=1 Tax=Rubroshorea leprosula TaxID=152421 RepID=A0AAV5JUA0_9ROSI|nr:hypothetical protein SLEP1_g26707 [Rubroshorea leprosula]